MLSARFPQAQNNSARHNVTYCIQNIAWRFRDHQLLTPLVLSKGSINAITEAICQVTLLETDDSYQKQSIGYGTVLLSHVWAWPEKTDHDIDKNLAMQNACANLSQRILTQPISANVLQLGFMIHSTAADLLTDLPPLARCLCVSPIDNAVHDAAGRSANCNAFDLFDVDMPSDFDAYFPGIGASLAITSLLRPPVNTLEGQVVIGANTPQTAIESYVLETGMKRAKIKIGHESPEKDASHVAKSCAGLRELTGYVHSITVDANGAYGDPAELERFIAALFGNHPEEAIYLTGIEQPALEPEFTQAAQWAKIARNTPLIIDEAFTSMNALVHQGKCGWNALATKSCRGQTLSLIGAAWAHARGWTNFVMDLTSPNIAAIHTLLLASRIRGVDTLELNAGQFMPDVHHPFAPELKSCLYAHKGIFQVPTQIIGLTPEAYYQHLTVLFEEHP